FSRMITRPLVIREPSDGKTFLGLERGRIEARKTAKIIRGSWLSCSVGPPAPPNRPLTHPLSSLARATSVPHVRARLYGFRRRPSFVHCGNGAGRAPPRRDRRPSPVLDGPGLLDGGFRHRARALQPPPPEAPRPRHVPVVHARRS